MSWGIQPDRGLLNLSSNPHLLTAADFPPPPAYDGPFGFAPPPIPMAAPPIAFAPGPPTPKAAAPVAFASPPVTWSPPSPPVAIPVPVQAPVAVPVAAGPPPMTRAPPPQPWFGGYIPPPYVPYGGPPAPAPSIPNWPTEGSNLHFPGGRQPGYNILFSKEYASLHQFIMDSAPWDSDEATENAEVQKLHVDCNWNVRQLLEALRPGQDCKPWAITEVVEKGSGAWAKGSTVNYQSERAGLPIKILGWTGARKEGDKGPVWVWLHEP